MSFINKLKTAHANGQKAQKEGMSQLLNGGLGLAKTFWLYWFLCTVIISIFYSFTERNFSLLLLDAASVYVSVTAFIAIKHVVTESKKWRLAALTVMVISTLFTSLALLLNLFHKPVNAYLESIA